MAKATADIRSLARAQTALAIRTLTGVCGSKAAPAAARVSAAQALLDRGWGKAPQPHTGEDDKDIRITIRQITRARNDRRRPAATARSGGRTAGLRRHLDYRICPERRMPRLCHWSPLTSIAATARTHA